MVFAMSEIVFEVVAFGFERIVMFIFDFPPSATGFDNRRHSVICDRMIGNKSVVVEEFAIASSHAQFTPVNQQGIGSVP